MTRPWLLAGGGVVLVIALLAVGRTITKPAAAPPKPAVIRAPRVEAVSALGTLQPAGDIRKLAAPTSAMGGSPRLLSLQVEEGQRVLQGQLLATFDSRPRLVADLAAVTARIDSLQAQIRMQRREVERYQSAASSGAAALVLLEEKKDDLVKLVGQLREALAQNSGRLFTVRHVWKIKDLSHYQAGVDALVQHADFPALAEQLAKVVETETIHFASAMPYAPAE